MPLEIAFALTLIGLVLGLVSAGQILAANPGERFPWSGRPKNNPRKAATLRAVGGGLTIFGALNLYPLIGAGIIPLVLVVTAGPLLLFVAHNRRLARTPRQG